MQEVEYYYDLNGTKHEVGPSMKDIIGSAHVISCPICRACRHQFLNEETDAIECRIIGIIQEDIAMSRVFRCTEYLANKDSYYYDLVTKLIETQKPIE